MLSFFNKKNYIVNYSSQKIDEINNVTIDNIPMNQPSICIPRTLPNITKEKVLEVFKHYNMGEIV